MTYSELLFIKAEAAERGWITGSAATLYTQAITASMEQWGVAAAAIAAYLAKSGRGVHRRREWPEADRVREVGLALQPRDRGVRRVPPARLSGAEAWPGGRDDHGADAPAVSGRSRTR